MEHGADWQLEATARIGARIAYFRERAKDPQGRRLTAQVLADMCTELGLTIGRPAIAKLEKGLRQTITVGELQIIARALKVSPADLMFPLGQEPTVEQLPGLHRDTWSAVLWWSGMAARPGRPAPAIEAGVVHLYQVFYQLLEDWTFAGEAHRRTILTGLHGIRRDLADRGLIVPALPSEVAAALNGSADG